VQDLLFLFQLFQNFAFDFQYMFGYRNFFWANPSALKIIFAAPRAMWLIHNLQTFYGIFDSMLKTLLCFGVKELSGVEV